MTHPPMDEIGDTLETIESFDPPEHPRNSMGSIRDRVKINAIIRSLIIIIPLKVVQTPAASIIAFSGRIKVAYAIDDTK
ncbi:MAG TPA: hypothetical protein VE870_12605 [Bacteroidales bacterium]|nr:hypothetical protein [Bacteroidales bacterium]